MGISGITSSLGRGYASVAQKSATAASSGGALFSQLLRNAQSVNVSPVTGAATESTTPAVGHLERSGAASLSELKAELSQSRDSFHEKLSRLLQEQGIDTSVPISLQGDSFGGVRVANNHPEALAIENLIADHPELTSMFNEMSALAGLVRAYEEATGAREQLARGPGIMSLSSSDGTARIFRLNVSEEGAEIAFVHDEVS